MPRVVQSWSYLTCDTFGSPEHEQLAELQVLGIRRVNLHTNEQALVKAGVHGS